MSDILEVDCGGASGDQIVDTGLVDTSIYFVREFAIFGTLSTVQCTAESVPLVEIPELTA